MTDVSYDDRTRAPDNGAVRQTAGAVKEGLADAAGTAKEQAKQVGGEAKVQARNLAHDVRNRAKAEARTQNDRLADTVRTFADELDEMAGQRGDTPASKVVTQLSQGGRRFADYLAENGPEGVLEGVQDFARRRPGTFLAVAAAAGFVAGRLGKGVLNAAEDTTGAHRAYTSSEDLLSSEDLAQAPTQRLSPPPPLQPPAATLPPPPATTPATPSVTPSVTVVETFDVTPGYPASGSDPRNVRP